MNYNTEQLEAINFGGSGRQNGPCLVTAIPGSGKCVSGDTLVLSLGGEKIHEISKNANYRLISTTQEDISFPTLKENCVKEFYVNPSLEKTIEIKTQGGFSLKATPNHPIAVVNEYGKFEWKLMQNIKEGEIVPIFCNRDFSFAGHDEWWYLMGLLMGDGWIRDWGIGFSQERNSVAEEFIRLCMKFFGKKPTEQEDKRSKAITYAVHGREISNQYRDCFGDCVDKLAQFKVLTTQIRKGTFTQIASLLRGLFDTDGYLDGGSVVGITLASEKLISEIHVMLLQYGVFSTKTIKVVNEANYYRLHIMGNDLRRFYKHIGFLSHQKKCFRLAKAATRISNCNRKFDNLQMVMTKLRDYARDNFGDFYNGKKGAVYGKNGEKLIFPRYLSNSKNKRSITENSIDRILRIFESHLGPNKFNEQTRYLYCLKRYYQFARVVKVEVKEDTIQVYDYVVEDSHSFIANGFINHNTRIITSRVNRLIEEGEAPESIIVITFTNKAAGELKERCEKQVGERAKKVFVSTFHKMASTILRNYGQSLGYNSYTTIIDEDDQVDLLGKIARAQERELTKPQLKHIAWAVNDWREKVEETDGLYERLSSEHTEIALEYIRRLNQQNMCDFAGLLSECLRLFRTDKNVLDKLQSRLKFLMCDECQDVNKINMLLIEELMSHNNNVLLVGDPCQSVYRFRGSLRETMDQWIEKYKPVEIVLKKNYRSTPQILAVAQKLIEHNVGEGNIELLTDNPPGPPVLCNLFRNDQEEATNVIAGVRRLVSTGKYQYKDCAVLYRVNSMSLPLEMACIAQSVPFQVTGGFSFFDRACIKDAIAMLRFLVNPKDSIAFHRFANKSISRHLGDITVGKIEKKAAEDNISVIAAMKLLNISTAANIGMAEIINAYAFDHSKMGLADTLNHLLEALRYKEYIEQNNDKEKADEKLDHIEKLLEDCVRNAEDGMSVSDYLEHVSLVTSEDKNEDDDNKLQLCSAHSSKGKEWKVVFVCGCEDGLFPHARSISEGAAAVDEELRLLYICITRAKLVSSISHCGLRQVGYAKAGQRLQYKKAFPSPFLYYCGLLKKPSLPVLEN